MENKICILFLFIFSTTISLNAQWQPDTRLTFDPANSHTSPNNAWTIASKGDSIHIVWSDDRNNIQTEIYYKNSTNGGTTWGADQRLTLSPGLSKDPSLFIVNSLLHLVWYDQRTGSIEIFYKRSTNAGSTWTSDTQLTVYNSTSWRPSLSSTNSTVHLTWEDERDYNYEIYYKNSTNSGLTWGNDMRLTNDTSGSFRPSVSSSGMFVYIVWTDNRNGFNSVYYKRSSDGGTTWSEDIRLVNTAYISESPSIASNGPYVHAVWTDNRNGNHEIYYKKSTNNGYNWGNDIRLTTNDSIDPSPSISLFNSVVHIVWARDNSAGLYYKRSTDNGITWEQEICLTHNILFNSVSPSISAANSGVHVIWTDNRDYNYEIYYKRNPLGNIGINKISSEIPQLFTLHQNYPNPFNPVTKIKFDVPELSFIELKIFDVTGRELSVIADREMKPGTYEADWDGSNFSSGVYFYRLETNKYSETRKMVLIK